MITNQTTRLRNFFDVVENLQPEVKEYERMEDIAERVAESIRKYGFLVRYDRQTAPMIDAAVLRNPYEEEDLPALEKRLKELGMDEYVILLNSVSEPASLAELIDGEAWPLNFLTYAECVQLAEAGLSALLSPSSFDLKGYSLYLGAAWAIVKAEHPDWNYETFIEYFRKDVVDQMVLDIRT
jgi:hypothetical protein